MKAFLIAVGALHIVAVILGSMNFIEYRLYVGLEDKVIVSKADLETLKQAALEAKDCE